VATLLYEQRFADLGIGIGSEMVLEIEGREYRFEIIGLIEDTDGPPSTFGEMQIPGDTLGNLQPDFKITTLQVDDEHLEDVMLRLSSMPGFFPLNIEFIDGIISRLINQFSALPLLVGILSLGAAAVIMANTVALATLERRKQIGILKAVGLKSKRVLGIMLLENVMVSLLGGFLGIGLSVIGVVVMTYFGLEDFILIPDDARPVAIILVVSAVVIGTAATILSASAAVRERVLNVLRYE